jgi:hypothetical protein
LKEALEANLDSLECGFALGEWHVYEAERGF